MGRKTGSVQKKTVKIPRMNNLYLLLFDSDIIEYYTVDERGYIATNKRAWVGLKATVIIGKHDTTCQDIDHMKNMRLLPVFRLDDMFYCEVIAGGFISSLGKGYAGQEVTVIINDRH